MENILDKFKQAVGNFTSKKGKDVLLPNEAPITEARKQEHARRLSEDVSKRFQKVAERSKQYNDSGLEQELLKRKQ